MTFFVRHLLVKFAIPSPTNETQILTWSRASLDDRHNLFWKKIKVATKLVFPRDGRRGKMERVSVLFCFGGA